MRLDTSREGGRGGSMGAGDRETKTRKGEGRGGGGGKEGGREVSDSR